MGVVLVNSALAAVCLSVSVLAGSDLDLSSFNFSEFFDVNADDPLECGDGEYQYTQPEQPKDLNKDGFIYKLTDRYEMCTIQGYKDTRSNAMYLISTKIPTVIGYLMMVRPY